MLAKKPVIFCDFDGTITVKDNIMAIMRKFAPPEWEPLAQQILGQEISIREGVGQLFALLPSTLEQDITDFALEQAEIRPGFERFLEHVKRERLLLNVVSGGIDFFLDPILAPFQLEDVKIYRNESDFSGERIKILWPYPCDAECNVDCGLCKTSIIRSYPSEQYFKIVIGDSITDLAGAKIADIVFARGLLLEKCKELGLRYYAYETFDDILQVLTTEPWNYQSLWEELTELKELFARRDWFPGTSGNLSVKTQAEPLRFLVTASGKDKSKTTNEDFLLVDQDSQPSYLTHLKPSAETTIHEAIYKQMGAGAVVHVHTIYNNLISDIYREQGCAIFAGNELIKAFDLWDEDAQIKVPIVHNYANIPLLTAEVKAVLNEGVPGVLIHQHGIYAWGKNIFEAKKHLEAFEFLFELRYKRLSLHSN